MAISENDDLARKGALIDEALAMIKKLSDAGQLPLPMNVMKGLLEKLKKEMEAPTPEPAHQTPPEEQPATRTPTAPAQ